jgi:hypothetical protein
MARYDTSLAEERGAVRAGQHRDLSYYRTAYGYDRNFDPHGATYWKRPSELRGYRGGSAFGYGYGGDYDSVYRGGGNRDEADYGEERIYGGYRGARYGGRYDMGYAPLGPQNPITRQLREERQFQAERAAPGMNDYTGTADTGGLYGSNYNYASGRFGANFYGGRYGADYFQGRNGGRGHYDRGY